MIRSVRVVTGCIVGILLAFDAAAQTPQTDVFASPLRSFDWTYMGLPEPGNRHWSSPDGITWTETLPSGHSETQKVTSVTQVGGCNGVITAKSNSGGAQTFIPNPGCPFMVLLFRMNGDSWRPLGLLRSLSTTFSASASSASRPRTISGSGVFVNADGDVLTNAHVAGACKSILVRAYDASPTPGTLDAVDPKNDLALIKTRAGYGERAVFRALGRPTRLGENVGVLGYPLVGMLSSEPKATFGQVNSVAGMNNDYTLLQISAPVQPGNSGGPVFGEDGLVLGIVVSQASPALLAITGSIPQNINFAIRGELAQIFLSAHGVSFRSRATSERLGSADIAEAGERSTAQILCSKS